MIRRHSATAIFMHWYNAACWLLLLVHGVRPAGESAHAAGGGLVELLDGPGVRRAGAAQAARRRGMAWIVLYAAYLLVRVGRRPCRS